MVSQFEDLQNCYMKLRRGESGALSANRAGQPGAADANGAGPSQHPTRLQITANGKHNFHSPHHRSGVQSQCQHPKIVVLSSTSISTRVFAKLLLWQISSLGH